MLCAIYDVTALLMLHLQATCRLTLSENSRYSFFSGAGLVTVSTALYARRARSFLSSVSPSIFHGSFDDADAKLFIKASINKKFGLERRKVLLCTSLP